MKYLRERDDNCHYLCKIQANIFAKSSKRKIPSCFFAKVFMCSKYASAMDDLTYLDSNISEEVIYQNIVNEIHMQRGIVYEDYIMEWIGYLYREWSYRLKINSSYLIKKVPVTYLAKVYYPYHSLDILKAIQEIAKDRKINLKNSLEDKMRIIMATLI